MKSYTLICICVIAWATLLNNADGFVNRFSPMSNNVKVSMQLDDGVVVRKEKKYIVVTGGVISGIGKGVTASSIGVILKMLNLRPTAIKIDPYLNVDAGTMSPGEHGEVFVLDDGSETDLDLGNYERFLDVKLTNDSNLTTGKIYQDIMRRERAGEYLGKTVQIIPHVTDEIIRRIRQLSTTSVSNDDSSEEPDVCVIELGGTIGDLESGHFVEALRQLQLLVKKENFCLIHVSMVPIMGESQEQKTKPTQHSVKELRSAGFSPDFIVCRAKKVIDKGSRNKISLFCNVEPENVLSIPDVSNIYHVPLLLLEQNFHNLISKKLNLNVLQQEKLKGALDVNKEMVINDDLVKSWDNMVKRIDEADDEVSIVLIGNLTY
jgi:CTP synthase